MSGFAALGLTGLVLGVIRAEPEVEPCALRDKVEALQGDEPWTRLREQVDDPRLKARLVRLGGRVESIARRSERICRSQSERQHYGDWIEDLRSEFETAEQVLSSGGTLGTEQLERLRELDHRRADRPPPAPLGHDVAKALKSSEQFERKNSRSDALTAANEAFSLARRHGEEAAALVRRARVLALLERYPEASADFKAAMLAADSARDPDLRLRASLLAARITLMRLEDVDRAKEHLDVVDAVLVGYPESRLSSRHTELAELRASVAKREGQKLLALRMQLWVVLRQLLVGDRRELGMALLNLGTMFDWIGQAKWAEASFRKAVEVLPPEDPGYPQAAGNLGRALMLSHQEDLENLALAEEARRYLQIGARPDSNIRSGALADLTTLSINAGWPEQMRDSYTELEKLLHANPPPSARLRFEAWQAVVLGRMYVEGRTPEFDKAYSVVMQEQERPAARGELDCQLARVAPTDDLTAEFVAQVQSRAADLPEDEKEPLLECIADLL
ncbi:MAG: hypothetical protein HC927_05345 [Deltaproteobacteria bacterium]|nr:hypothetical protein [Deltaproteobacteria bacterium]